MKRYEYAYGHFAASAECRSIPNQMPLFKKAYKKLHIIYKVKIDEAIRLIIQNPKIGEEKKDDLSGVYVYKFKVHHQEYLLAYEWNSQERLLVVLGVHHIHGAPRADMEEVMVHHDLTGEVKIFYDV